MIAKDRWSAPQDRRMAIYLGAAGVLLILEGLAFALTAASSPPDRPASYSLLTAAGVVFGLALVAAGVATLLHRRFGLAAAAAVAVVVLNVAYGVTTGSLGLAAGGIGTALAILVLVVSGRPQFRG